MKKANSVINNQRTQHCNSYSDVSSNSSEKLYMEPESPESCDNHMQNKREVTSQFKLLVLSGNHNTKYLCFSFYDWRI